MLTSLTTLTIPSTSGSPHWTPSYSRETLTLVPSFPSFQLRKYSQIREQQHRSKQYNSAENACSLSELREHQQLWYKITVPVCDLRNLTKDHTSERRTECTTDELYINAPYFTPGVASRIKAAVLGKSANHDDISLQEGITFPEGQTIKEAIKSNLVTFFEKWIF